jgi:hypothetical protein
MFREYVAAHLSKAPGTALLNYSLKLNVKDLRHERIGDFKLKLAEPFIILPVLERLFLLLFLF